jgi:hypothetical protein
LATSLFIKDKTFLSSMQNIAAQEFFAFLIVAHHWNLFAKSSSIMKQYSVHRRFERAIKILC